MRELTEAEYRTILAILSRPFATDRNRILESGVPSSTYNVVRRRVYEEEWLSDILVPNPGPCGLAGIEIAVARPSLEARMSLVNRWVSDPDCSMLWIGLHLLFAVFFRAQMVDERSVHKDVPFNERTFTLQANGMTGDVPVYFDFSGAWARFGGFPPPNSYPAGLDLRAAPAELRLRTAVMELLTDGGRIGPSGSRWRNLLHINRTPRRAIERGAIKPRSVLNLAKLPPMDGRRMGEIILVHGLLRPGMAASQLLNTLTAECGVYPFLFARGGEKLVLGGIGQTSAKSVGRVPIRSARKGVLPTLIDYLNDAEVLIEPVESIEERVCHRYVAPPRDRTPSPG